MQHGKANRKWKCFTKINSGKKFTKHYWRGYVFSVPFIATCLIRGKKFKVTFLTWYPVPNKALGDNSVLCKWLRTTYSEIYSSFAHWKLNNTNTQKENNKRFPKNEIHWKTWLVAVGPNWLYVAWPFNLSLCTMSKCRKWGHPSSFSFSFFHAKVEF